MRIQRAQRAILLCFLLISSGAGLAQIYTGPIPKPTSGYGSDGVHAVSMESFANPHYPTENIQIYYPTGITSSVPTLFYSHGYGGTNSLHVIGLLNFFAKKGYAIVFVPYQTTGVSIDERYVNLTEGFRKAARDYPNIIDTTQVGFLGHSFGGGATIGVSYACFTENNWGSNGRFICPSAQWYSFHITQPELQSFPLDTKMLTFIYENDSSNDHRMAVEVFSNINIPSAEKDLIKVFPSTVSGYDYTSEHNLPTTYAAFDAMDYYAYYRLIDALCDYTFNGNLAGKEVALGNGSILQTTMPAGMAPLVQSDAPVAAHPESIYGFPCSSFANPRQDYCSNSLASLETNTVKTEPSIFPNPVQTAFTVSFPDQQFSLEIFDCTGRTLFLQDKINSQILVNSGSFSRGLFLVKVTCADGSVWMDKGIKE